MKRTFKAFLCLSLSALLAFGGTGAALGAALGDVTDDAVITAEDARVILRAAVGLETLDAAAAAKADMDTDGRVTAADARLALRTAVGLNLTINEVYQNQYDILRSGAYSLELDAGDETGMEISCTVNGDKRYISTQVSDFGDTPVKMSFYVDGNDLFFVDDAYEIYTKLDADALSFLGEDAGFLDEFSEITDQIGVFGDLQPLGQADYQRRETFADTDCDSYWFMNDEGTVKIYMDGVKLVGLVRVDAQGRTVAVAEFKTVSAVLPANAFNFMDRYTEVSDVITFMLISFGSLLGGEGLSPEEIQQLIDEAKNG